MKDIKVWLDDERPASLGWYHFYTAESMIAFFEAYKGEYNIDYITLDNDLGDNALEGYDAVKKLVDLGVSAKWWNIHSENVIAVDNMHAYLSNAMFHDRIKTDNMYNYLSSAMYYHMINEATITTYKAKEFS